jgi:hypothetical protein
MLQDTSAWTGVLELAVVGTAEESEADLFPMSLATVSRGSHGKRALAFRFPVLMAHFGSLTSCHKTRIVMANPDSGCMAFNNERLLPNAIVLVERGSCSFADKAANIQVCHKVCHEA